jgi:4-diphosphocytidyl-2-C-methyl-D-erythritol kinase
VFAPLELADELTIEPATRDEVVAPGVEGPNLVQHALSAFRTKAALSPLRVTIEKRIPVAGGLGGGSADAAATLRAANRIAGEPLGLHELRSLGAPIGADVPSQLDPAPALVTGAGEVVEPLDLPELWLVLVPSAEGLSTAAVYAEHDRGADPREPLDPDALRALAGATAPALAPAMENDLEEGALSLRPELESTLKALDEAGALAARLSGSGPTAFGLFEDRPAAEAAAGAIPGAIVTNTRPSPASQ